ncbi:hypothetical protein [Bifidobacterium leontopitheci]|nr:hypothetical protein [Bifidobacterium leontopitheci]
MAAVFAASTLMLSMGMIQLEYAAADDSSTGQDSSQATPGNTSDAINKDGVGADNGNNAVDDPAPAEGDAAAGNDGGDGSSLSVDQSNSGDDVVSNNAEANSDGDDTGSEEKPEDSSQSASNIAASEASWSVVPSFASAYQRYESDAQKRLATLCKSNGCAVSKLKDNGLVKISDGYKGSYTADASGGIITNAQDTSVQSATTYQFTVPRNTTGKFSIRNNAALSGTRPSFIMAAHGPFDTQNGGSYVYAGYIGDQRNGLRFSSSGDFSSWLNKSSNGSVQGDQFLGLRTASLCGTSFCTSGSGAEGNWLYFNNTTAQPITVFVVLTAQGTDSTKSAARLQVSYAVFDNGDKTPVYRVINKKTRFHHFTASRNEYLTLIRGGQWQSEGIPFYAAKKGTNVYRLYYPKNGAHFFTKSAAERNAAMKVGWRYEGVAFHVHEDGLRDVYRLYNPYTGDRLFSTYSEWRAVGRVTFGWRQEGIGWNAL